MKSRTRLLRDSCFQENLLTFLKRRSIRLNRSPFPLSIRLPARLFPNCLASNQRKQIPPRLARNVVALFIKRRTKGARCTVDVARSSSRQVSFDARLAASIFFPQFRILGCDVDQSHTPAVLRKIATAAARSSFEIASKNLADLADLDVSPKQCQRIAIRIGGERMQEQAKRVANYQQQTLPIQQHGQALDAPANNWTGRVAVVLCDGGRAQIRDELWGEEKPNDRKHRWWRESHCGVLQTIQSSPSHVDPHPMVPEELKDPLWIVPKMKEIHRQRAANEPDGECATTPTLSHSPAASRPESKPKSTEAASRWSGGVPLVKTVIATRQGYDQLGISMATEAFNRGFNKAAYKAFLGDGLKVNWSLWSRHFSHYTPITDLMHAISYVYAAAIATCSQMDEGWTEYLRWLELVWSGKVMMVVDEMKSLIVDNKPPPEDLTSAITYLTNNASRMKYDEYRKNGLPITTSRVESTQKQINNRVKGTEKFWNDESLEPVLQLVSDDLSDNFNSDQFWERRQQRFNGYREPTPRRNTKTLKS
jgi:hypothetical protein